MNDLILRYQFTDRAGRGVYHIHDAMPIGNRFGWEIGSEIIGQIRMKKGEDFLTSFDITLDWIEQPEEES